MRICSNRKKMESRTKKLMNDKEGNGFDYEL